MKRTILFFSILLVAGAIHAQKVFKKYGVDKESVTLSKGRYVETFTNEEVMRIGTVLFNTKTNKVVEFLDEETADMAYKEEYSSRFMTMDPLAEKYPWLSPYSYCANNPVRYIDPTGMDWYQADNGNVMWRRSQDADYTDDDGNVWQNIGTEYLMSAGKNLILFKQHENENGELSLYSTTDRKEIGGYLGQKWSDANPLTEKGLENVYPEFDVIAIGRGLVNTLSKVAVTSATKEGTSLIPLGLGSTGRVTATNLSEELAMKEIMSNPNLGQVVMTGMKDSRWLGWSKMQYVHYGQDGTKTTIHYVGKWVNGVLKAVDDFKFK
jgi:hypothetical protein